MTLSDMSTVTAEVKVDETDIVSVKLGQDGDVNIDAIPGKVFKGKVTEVGSQAVLRSSGLTTTQTTTSTQEAKDFKVVVTLENPPDNVRPGLSATAKSKTAVFRSVETGISGVTDIEITKGLQPGDEIVVGSYKALRTLKPEAQVKVDNSAPKRQDDQQS